jgi:uncharacterized protein YigA (DUF484 family)
MNDALLRRLVQLTLDGGRRRNVAAVLRFLEERLETRFNVAVPQLALLGLADPLLGGFDIRQRRSPVGQAVARAGGHARQYSTAVDDLQAG